MRSSSINYAFMYNTALGLLGDSNYELGYWCNLASSVFECAGLSCPKANELLAEYLSSNGADIEAKETLNIFLRIAVKEFEKCKSLYNRYPY